MSQRNKNWKKNKRAAAIAADREMVNNVDRALETGLVKFAALLAKPKFEVNYSSASADLAFAKQLMRLYPAMVIYLEKYMKLETITTEELLVKRGDDCQLVNKLLTLGAVDTVELEGAIAKRAYKYQATVADCAKSYFHYVNEDVVDNLLLNLTIVYF